MSSTVADTIRGALPTLPRAERRVARELLSSYPVAGLETVARLAARAGVSGPTVIRLVSRLGFDGYPEFQEALRGEIDERSSSPLVQYERLRRSGKDDVLARSRDLLAGGVSRSFDETDGAAFAQAVDLLCDRRRRVFAAGGRFSGLTARTLVSHLEILRPGVRHLSDDTRVAFLMEVKRGDVLVLFDMRRYQASTVQMGREAAQRGAVLIVVTDPWLSPAAVEAEVVLPVSVESPSPFDSQVAALAMVEALVAACVERYGDTVKSRVEDYDALWDVVGFAYPDRSGGTP